MSGMIEEVGRYLQLQGCGTQGTDLFLNDLPDLPTASLSVYEEDGHGADHVLGDLMEPIEWPRLLVVARDLTEPLARKRAQKAKRALRQVVNTTLTADDATSAYYLIIEPEGETTVVDRDENLWVVVGFTAQVQRQSSAQDAS
jgi:hypothetical protein